MVRGDTCSGAASDPAAHATPDRCGRRPPAAAASAASCSARSSHRRTTVSSADRCRATTALTTRCDATTNPPFETEQGRVTCVIGVQPPYPAEFVIVRIGVARDGVQIRTDEVRNG